MVVLITISAILVIAAVAAAIFTSHDLDALKKEIVKLEKTQIELLNTWTRSRRREKLWRVPGACSRR